MLLRREVEKSATEMSYAMAGCSRNYVSRSDIQGLKPPLDKDFFEIAAIDRKVLDYREPRTYICDAFNSHPRSIDDPQINFEDNVPE